MKLGVETFTILEECMQDFEGAMKKLNKLGFQYLEWLNIAPETDPGLGNGLSPAEAKKIFDHYGLRLNGSIFVGPTQEKLLFDFDKIQKMIDWHYEMGCTTLGVGSDKFQNADFLKRRMEAYNEIGRRCKDAGIDFVYHNHFHEQQHINGRPILEQLVEMTDAELVGFDLDVYWCLRGLVNPVKFINRLGNRVKALHAKDFPFERLDHVNISKLLDADKPITYGGEDYMDLIVPEDFIECGQGIIKWQEIVDAGNAVGCPYIYVEQDYTRYSKFECLAVSKDYLSGLSGLSMD